MPIPASPDCRLRRSPKRRNRPRYLTKPRRQSQSLGWPAVKTHVQPWLPAIVLVWLAGVAAVCFPAAFELVHRAAAAEGGRFARRRAFATCWTARRRSCGSPVRSRCCNRRWCRRRSWWATSVRWSCCRYRVVTGLPESQLELILAHELAHIRRHDYLVNLLQTLVETLFFYHPAVWWLSRQIRHERENCCDDVAICLSGNRADYGRALLAIEEFARRRARTVLAAGGGWLLARIRRIAGCETTPRSAGGVVFAALVVPVADLPRSYCGDQPRPLKRRRQKRTTSPAKVPSQPSTLMSVQRRAKKRRTRQAERVHRHVPTIRNSGHWA